MSHTHTLFNTVLWGLSTTQRTRLSGFVWGLAGQIKQFWLNSPKIGFQLYSQYVNLLRLLYLHQFHYLMSRRTFELDLVAVMLLYFGCNMTNFTIISKILSCPKRNFANVSGLQNRPSFSSVGSNSPEFYHCLFFTVNELFNQLMNSDFWSEVFSTSESIGSRTPISVRIPFSLE